MMRNSTGANSTSAKKSQKNILSSAEKNSAKKLVQARLPFKVIAPGSSPTDESATTTAAEETKQVEKTARNAGYRDSTDARKRKLSYDSESDDKEKTDNVSKENVEIKTAGTKKKKTSSTKVEAEDVISLIDDDGDVNTHDNNKVALDTPTVTSKSQLRSSATKAQKNVVSKEQGKGAGTPKTVTPKGHKEKISSATKLQIKLPISNSKKSKRRKSKADTLLANTSTSNDLSHISCAESCDDIEEIANELNPQKRTKFDYAEMENNTETTERKKSPNTAALKDKPEQLAKDTNKEDNKKVPIKKSENEKHISKATRSTTRSQQCAKIDKNSLVSKSEECLPSEEITDKERSEEHNESILIPSDDDDIEDAEADEDADDETDNKCLNDVNSDSNAKNNSAIESVKNTEDDKQKTMTPKMKQLMERRQMARQEKERKLLEERQKKQQEKEEKESARKREREEKEDQKRKEREEKEEQRRKEREEKERKRLAEIEAKNEEKRKRNEAKEEELRKKEDERKRKELEKEEVELKKKKAAQAFTKFFVAKTASNTQQALEEDENTGDGIKTLAFRPFQIKGDMKLAPINRKILSPESKSNMESLVPTDNNFDNDTKKIKPLPKSKLYLQELKSGQIKPGKWRRPSTESKDDVVIVEDELERVGQEIVEDTPAYIREEMRVKFYKFHDNRRPPYYGTFRKKSKIVSGRKPFVQDKKFFDYDVDSDDEWEEEEPGESLEDGSDDDKEKESEDDDYEVDNEWFVPHGHLSDEELQNEDECGLGDDNTREAQKAKLQIIQQEFAQEMKKKTEKIKPRLIGCIWAGMNGQQPPECPTLIWETLGKRSMLFSHPPIVDEPKIEEPGSPTGPNAEIKLKPIALSDAMAKDLIRLVHGNNNSKNFLIKEYIAYLDKTVASIKNGEFCNLAKSVVREKIDSFAEWQAVEKGPTSNINNETTNKKKKLKKRLCWVVHSDVLDKMDMSSINIHQNTWEYTLSPKNGKKTEENVESTEATVSDKVAEPANEITKSDNKSEDKTQTSGTGTQSITKLLTNVKKDKKPTALNSPCEPGVPSDKPRKTNNKPNSSSPQTPKEKKRVPLLMSVGRSEHISTPAKNKLISQFLKKGRNASNNISTRELPEAIVIDDEDVVILD